MAIKANTGIVSSSNKFVSNYRLRKISRVAILKFETQLHKFIIENHASETINR